MTDEDAQKKYKNLMGRTVKADAKFTRITDWIFNVISVRFGGRLFWTFTGAMQRGFLYLVAVMDWATRRVLSWRLSNTLDTRFCLEVLDEAIELYGPPQMFNSDQGSQFTSLAYTTRFKAAGITISV